jgi:hypothetical protein
VGFLNWRNSAQTRSWGPFSCHSSAAITSCFSMIIQGPMSQESVHHSWKLKMAQVFHGLHTHQTCHHLSCMGCSRINVYDNMLQFLPISSNFTQPLKRSGTTGHRPDQLYAKEMCRTAWGKRWSPQILTGFQIHAPTFFLKVSVTRCISVFLVMWNP